MVRQETHLGGQYRRSFYIVVHFLYQYILQCIIIRIRIVRLSHTVVHSTIYYYKDPYNTVIPYKSSRNSVSCHPALARLTRTQHHRALATPHSRK